ncbi:hypothetical protein RU30_26090 [Salmonella enterica subsp. enterica serovar Give]|nr:hypothetical protein [Salmonella enterica subsp. enterica serovar Give]ECM4408888.1 hypothetical protein [Salmonella enterica subsp. enterica serovar Give]EED4548544.1 hypothetical protein [Salmonella enterica subsp. enterica serovar Give]
MLQMKFKPRFIEAFRSGQKITSLRMMDFKCRCYDDGFRDQPLYVHSDTLKSAKEVIGVYPSAPECKSEDVHDEWLKVVSSTEARQPVNPEVF